MEHDAALPHERLRIVCKTSEEQGEIELPLRLLFFGDFAGKDERPIDERLPVRVDRDSFPRVLAAHAPRLELTVSSRAPEGRTLRISLVFRNLRDFEPDSIAEQIPETRRLIALRDALTSLKSTGDADAFRERLTELVEDASAREGLLARVGLGAS